MQGCTTTPTGPRDGAGPAGSAEGRPEPDKLASVPWLTLLAPLMPQVTAANAARAMEAELAHCRSAVAGEDSAASAPLVIARSSLRAKQSKPGGRW